MGTGKRKSPPWTQIQPGLSYLGQEDLLEIIHDLYRLNPDNQVFLTSRLGLDDRDALAEPYKRAIRDEFNPKHGFPR